MAESQSDNMIGQDFCGIADLRRFQHNAMATTFEVFVVHKNALYAEQAAWAAFGEIDHIENNLSRFIENSDVSRINSLVPRNPLQIGLDAFECLQISIEMSEQTNGAFDITFGSSHRGSNLLKVNESDHTIELETDGIKIDLGAIGKGYAVDRIGKVLRDWSINTTLISGGQSSILPIGTPAGLPGWPVTLSDPSDYSKVLVKMYLADESLGASGLRKGEHIVNPRTGKPAKGKLGAWATAKTAAMADALSTAFMVMPIDKVRTYCGNHSDTSAFIVLPAKKKGAANRIVTFGNPDKFISRI
jgi:thiamine biosynthesis lipoprotein